MSWRIWQTSFGIAVLMHLTILSAIGYALHKDTKAEIQYIEVTLNELYTGESQSQSPLAGQQPRTNQHNKTVMQKVEQPQKQPVTSSPEAKVSTQASKNVESVPAIPTSAEDVSDTPAFAANVSNIPTGDEGTGNNATGRPAGSRGSSNNSAGRSYKKPHVIAGDPPAYPAEARAKRWEGTVRVQVLISAAGKVQEVLVVAGSGYESLDRAAVEVLRRWLFSPAYKDGRPVADRVTVPITFKLE